MTLIERDVVLFTSFPPPFGGPSVWGTRIAEYLCGAGVRTIAVSWIGRPPEIPGLEVVRVDPAKPLLRPASLLGAGRDLPSGLRDLWRLGFFWAARDLQYGQMAEAAIALMRFPSLLRNLQALRLRNPALLVNGAHYWPGLLAVLARQHLPGSQLFIRAKGLDIDLIGRASPHATRFLLDSAETVVVASEYMRRAVVEDLGVPDGRVERIPNPVLLPELPDLPVKDPKVLFVGVLEAQKDPHTFLRAAALVASRVPHATFVLIGEGSLRAELEQLAVTLEIRDRVRFAGRMANERVLGEMATATALVLPSRREAFGIVLVEALASYTPCVVTDVGGMPEIVTPREGFIVAPGDVHGVAQAVSVLLLDPRRRDEMACNARDRAARLFSLPVVMRQWLRLLA